MPTNLTPPSYLKPWSIVEDEELRLLRELRQICDVLRHRESPDEVLHMRGVASAPFEIGRAGEIVKKLEEIGR